MSIQWVVLRNGLTVQHGIGRKATILAAVQTARKWVRNNCSGPLISVQYYKGAEVIRIDNTDDGRKWEKLCKVMSPRKPKPVKVSIKDISPLFPRRTKNGAHIRILDSNSGGYVLCAIRDCGNQWVNKDNILPVKKEG